MLCFTDPPVKGDKEKAPRTSVLSRLGSFKRSVELEDDERRDVGVATRRVVQNDDDNASIFVILIMWYILVA